MWHKMVNNWIDANGLDRISILQWSTNILMDLSLDLKSDNPINLSTMKITGLRMVNIVRFNIFNNLMDYEIHKSGPPIHI